MIAMLHALSAALVHFIWQGLLLACLLWMVLYAMRRRSPNARYLVCCFALLLTALAPLLTAAFLYSRPAPVKAAVDVLRAAGPIHLSAAAGSLRADWLAWLQRRALPLWCVGVLLFSLRLVLGYAQISILRRRAKATNDALLAMVTDVARRLGILGRVDVCVALAAESPGVMGWLRPVILLPVATIAGLTPDQLEAVLAHELAHIRRYDYLVNAAQVLIETLLFYHPCVWWISARVRRERELCCDDLAVRSCGNAVCYARALTKLEKLRLATPSLVLGSTGGPLHYRIQRLLGAAGQECAPSKLPVVLGLSFALTCLMFYLGDVKAQTKPEPPARTPAPAENVERPAEVRAAPKKRPEPPCSDWDLEKIAEIYQARQGKRELETRLQVLHAQEEFYRGMAKPQEPDDTSRHQLEELNRAILQTESRLAQLRDVYNDKHPEIRAVESTLKAMRAQHVELERRVVEKVSADAQAKAKTARMEEALEKLRLDMVAIETMIRVKEQDIKDAMARLTARQKACLAR